MVGEIKAKREAIHHGDYWFASMYNSIVRGGCSGVSVGVGAEYTLHEGSHIICLLWCRWLV